MIPNYQMYYLSILGTIVLGFGRYLLYLGTWALPVWFISRGPKNQNGEKLPQNHTNGNSRSFCCLCIHIRRAYVCIHIYTHIHVHMYAIHICVHIYVCVYICICLCAYIYICADMHSPESSLCLYVKPQRKRSEFLVRSTGPYVFALTLVFLLWVGFGIVACVLSGLSSGCLCGLHLCVCDYGVYNLEVKSCDLSRGSEVSQVVHCCVQIQGVFNLYSRDFLWLRHRPLL